MAADAKALELLQYLHGVDHHNVISADWYREAEAAIVSGASHKSLLAMLYSELKRLRVPSRPNSYLRETVRLERLLDDRWQSGFEKDLAYVVDHFWAGDAEHEYFRFPVRESVAPKYYKVVSEPLCFTDLYERIRNEEILSRDQLSGMFRKIHQNSKLFNREDHVITLEAMKLMNAARRFVVDKPTDFDEVFPVTDARTATEWESKETSPTDSNNAAVAGSEPPTMKVLLRRHKATPDVLPAANEQLPSHSDAPLQSRSNAEDATSRPKRKGLRFKGGDAEGASSGGPKEPLLDNSAVQQEGRTAQSSSTALGEAAQPATNSSTRDLRKLRGPVVRDGAGRTQKKRKRSESTSSASTQSSSTDSSSASSSSSTSNESSSRSKKRRRAKPKASKAEKRQGPVTRRAAAPRPKAAPPAAAPPKALPTKLPLPAQPRPLNKDEVEKLRVYESSFASLHAHFQQYEGQYKLNDGKLSETAKQALGGFVAELTAMETALSSILQQHPQKAVRPQPPNAAQ